MTYVDLVQTHRREKKVNNFFPKRRLGFAENNILFFSLYIKILHISMRSAEGPLITDKFTVLLVKDDVINNLIGTFQNVII